MGQLTASYDAGTAAAPLVGDTIGVALREDGRRAARRGRPGLTAPERAPYLRRARRPRSSAWRAACSPSASRRATASASGRRTARSGRCCSSRAPRVGAILVNVNPAYRPNELAYALGHSGVRLLVTAESFKTSDYLAMLADVRAELPALERVVTIDGERSGRRQTTCSGRSWSIWRNGDPGRSGALPRACSSTPTTRSTSSTRAARRATPRAPRSRITTS